MIKRNSDMTSTVKVNMRGGDGQAVITDVVSKGEYNGNARLLGTILLKPGCSIGAHFHENEEEIFYIIDGTATYNDNGTEVVLEKGDSCICLSGQQHAIANNGERDLVFFAAILTY